MDRKPKIVIVGAGPAGLVCAIKLTEFVDGKDILILEAGPEIAVREESRIAGSPKYNACGLGGAGLFSDGKLMYIDEKSSLVPKDPVVASLWESFPNHHLTEHEGISYYRQAFEIFEKFGIPIQKGNVDFEKIQETKLHFERHYLDFEYYESRQIEPAYLPKVVHKFIDYLREKGVTIKTNYKLNDIKDISYEKLVLATGKAGVSWISRQLANLGVTTTPRPIRLGVRVEMPIEVMSEITKVHRDLQLINKINDKTIVQTFCTCPGGKLLACQYPDFTLVGGFTDNQPTNKCNFALLVKTIPDVDNPLTYAANIVKAANKLGNSKPLAQRLGDLRKGKKTTEVNTTLQNFALESFTEVYPDFFVKALLKTIDKFDKAIPGVGNDNNIIAGPCLEFCYDRIPISRNMETSAAGIFVIGDAAGYDAGIIPAMVGGLLAAEGLSLPVR